MSLGPLYVFLGEVSVLVLCPFFNWVVVFLECGHVSSLYILEIRPLSEVSLANMFSHMVGSKRNIKPVRLIWHVDVEKSIVKLKIILRLLHVIFVFVLYVPEII